MRGFDPSLVIPHQSRHSSALTYCQSANTTPFPHPSFRPPRAGIHPWGGAAHPEHHRRVERGAAPRCQSIVVVPKCDTTPLTKLEHLYYLSPTTGPSPTLSPKEEPQPRGKPIPGPRGLNVPAHPAEQPTPPTAQAKAAISSSQGPGSPFPHLPGDGRSIDSTRQALPKGVPPASTLPIIGCVYTGLLHAGLPDRSTDPRIRRALVPLLASAVPAIRLPDRCTGTPVMFPVRGPVKCRWRRDRPHTTLTTAGNMWG